MAQAEKVPRTSIASVTHARLKNAPAARVSTHYTPHQLERMCWKSPGVELSKNIKTFLNEEMMRSTVLAEWPGHIADTPDEAVIPKSAELEDAASSVAAEAYSIYVKALVQMDSIATRASREIEAQSKKLGAPIVGILEKVEEPVVRKRKQMEELPLTDPARKQLEKDLRGEEDYEEDSEESGSSSSESVSSSSKSRSLENSSEEEDDDDGSDETPANSAGKHLPFTQ